MSNLWPLITFYYLGIFINIRLFLLFFSLKLKTDVKLSPEEVYLYHSITSKVISPTFLSENSIVGMVDGFNQNNNLNLCKSSIKDIFHQLKV